MKISRLWRAALAAVLLCAGCVHWPGVDTHEKHPVYPTAEDAYKPGQP